MLEKWERTCAYCNGKDVPLEIEPIQPKSCGGSNRVSNRMTKQEKLLKSIRNNPRAVRFDDACKIAEQLVFSRQGGKGSHLTYGRADEPLLLNFQNRDGYILPYQAKQLLAMVDKYATLSD